MNTERIAPTELAAKNLQYPDVEEIVRKIRSFTQKVMLVDAPKLAKKAGSSLAQNAVLLGALAGTRLLPVKTGSLVSAVEELVPQKHLDTNIKAFELGCASIEETEEKT
jgi:indolepyruvate ferredoxin oxidoreductase beta subunit